jgi:uncharacterized protein (DUF2267 family)
MSDQTMTLDSFYAAVMETGKMRTADHAARTSSAVLHSLGFNLSGAVKRELARALPADLAHELTRGWRLIHFRDTHLTMEKFARDVALHSGNTDPQYARMATAAVFGQLKRLIDDDLSRRVAKDLSPEVRDLWNAA